MTNATFVEFTLVGLIVIIQSYQGFKTRRSLFSLRGIVPWKSLLKLESFSIPLEHLAHGSPQIILKNISKYRQEDEEVGEQTIQRDVSKVSLVQSTASNHPVFEEILTAINVYLLRNKGATTDFNLIRDIVERNIDAEDEGINQTVTVPLYLGLMGTMVGIIFGLVNLFLVSGEGEDFEVQGFLLGVSIAMFASFYGLLWTVSNASFTYKKSKKILEKEKNSFYTFIQTELLPVLNQSVSSSVYMLHTNLVKFNDSFSLNLNHLSELLHKNYDALIAQDRILQHLDEIDISEFSKANVKVLQELKESTKDLYKFNQYMGQLNNTIEGTTKLSESFQILLRQSNNFEGLAGKLDSRVEESNHLMQFLNDHYQSLDERRDLIHDSVQKVDDVINKSLDSLRIHTKEKIATIKEIAMKEEDLMTKTFAENRSHIAKLVLLEDVNKQIAQMNTSITSGLEKNTEALVTISKRMMENKIQKVSRFQRFKDFFLKLRK